MQHAPYKNVKALGYKVQMDQIGADNLQSFVDWLACNRVRVVHFVRESALDTFYALQVRVTVCLKLSLTNILLTG